MRGSVRRTGAHQGSAPEPGYWARIYREYHEEVRCRFIGYVQCPHDVEDLVQSVFARLIAHNRELRCPHLYIRIVARHQLYSYWRRKRKGLCVEQRMAGDCNDHDMNAVYCDWESDPLEQLSRKEIEAIVGSMMTCLSPILAEALRLRFMSGLQLDEAAIRAGCSRETLKKRLKRAKQSFMEFMMDKTSDLD